MLEVSNPTAARAPAGPELMAGADGRSVRYLIRPYTMIIKQ